jgi:hypothetical protein
MDSSFGDRGAGWRGEGVNKRKGDVGTESCLLCLRLGGGSVHACTANGVQSHAHQYICSN